MFEDRRDLAGAGASEFERFFRVYFGDVKHRVRRLGHSAAVADDVCADVFALAHRHFDGLRSLEEGRQRAWLYRTADFLGRNQRRSALRYERMIDRLEREPFAEPLSPDRVYERAEERGAAESRTRRVLASLEMRHRMVLELADLDHLSGPEIARWLGISQQAVRLRVMRARRAFKREYEQRYGTPYTEENL